MGSIVEDALTCRIHLQVEYIFVLIFSLSPFPIPPVDLPNFLSLCAINATTSTPCQPPPFPAPLPRRPGHTSDHGVADGMEPIHSLVHACSLPVLGPCGSSSAHAHCTLLAPSSDPRHYFLLASHGLCLHLITLKPTNWNEIELEQVNGKLDGTMKVIDRKVG